MIGYDTFASARRYLIHLEKEGKTYFVTFCTRNRRTLPHYARDIVLQTCVADHEVSYWRMSRIKSTSAHRIKLGRIWQPEYFDRILRSDEDVMKKADYIAENPVRAGLVDRADQYPWSWSPYAKSAAEGGGAPLAAPLD